MKPSLRDGGHVIVPPDATATVRDVLVSDIRLPDNYVGMDVAHCAKLVHLGKQGASFSPPMVCEEGDGTYWLIDGRHRFLATIMLGRDSLLALVLSDVELWV
jgi:hypothetical protein